MRIKIYQINPERDTEHRLFKNLEWKPVDSSIYKLVYHGDVDAEDLEDVFKIFNQGTPPTFQGRSMSVSDVIAVEEGTDFVRPDHYYCDEFGFYDINFDESKAEDMDGMRVVYVTPGHTPLDIKIRDNLKGYQDAVEGCIECLYNNDGTIIVCNDESKLIGMKGNRRYGNDIIAGPFFVCGLGGEDFSQLTDEEVNKYMKEYAEPEEISDEEVQENTGFTFYCW